MFLEDAHRYFEYIDRVVHAPLHSALVKILGLFEVEVQAAGIGTKMKRQDLILMENLFHNFPVTRVFDLKGSKRGREVQITDSVSAATQTLMDGNLLEYIARRPLYLSPVQKAHVDLCIWNDTLFLAQWNVMDYSLLLGIDEVNDRIVVGIIDYVRKYTLDKRLESFAKSGVSGFVPGQGRPTVIEPKQYKTRFRRSMDQYFLLLPDKYMNILKHPPLSRPRPANSRASTHTCTRMLARAITTQPACTYLL